MKIDDIFVKKHIDRWIKAWNDHNLKEILSLYSDNILFRSSKIKSIYPERNSTIIINKKDLEEYFYLGLKKYSNLHFVPMGYFMKNNKVIFVYIGTPDKKIQWSVIEVFEFSSDNGLIEKSSVYYGVDKKFHY